MALPKKTSKNDQAINSQSPIIHFRPDKPMPSAVELENAILGAVLMESESFGLVCNVLDTEDCFYIAENQCIYRAIKSLFNRNVPIDLLTTANELRKMDLLELVGGAYHLTQLTARVNSSANIIEHAYIVKEYAIKRRLIAISATITDKSYDDTTDVWKVAETASKLLFDACGDIGVRLQTLDIIHRSIFEKMISEPDSHFIPTPINALNSVIRGWMETDLIIIAGRPGMGKTAFVLNCLLYAAQNNTPVGIFSIEMGKEQLAKRLLSIESNINITKIIHNNLSEKETEHLSNVAGAQMKLPIYIDDTPGLSLFQFKTAARKLVHIQKVKFIIIDYLQLMHGEEPKNREQEISKISRSLKATAKELNIPIIALSQLSRSCESRPDKRPMLSDLRESGAIEQDADIVLFLYRPEYYGFREDENGNSTDGVCETIIAKHRNGNTGIKKVAFEGTTQKFTDLQQEYHGRF